MHMFVEKDAAIELRGARRYSSLASSRERDGVVRPAVWSPRYTSVGVSFGGIRPKVSEVLRPSEGA